MNISIGITLQHYDVKKSPSLLKNFGIFHGWSGKNQFCFSYEGTSEEVEFIFNRLWKSPLMFLLRQVNTCKKYTQRSVEIFLDHPLSLSIYIYIPMYMYRVIKKISTLR